MKLKFIVDVDGIEVADFKFPNGIEVVVEKHTKIKHREKYRIIYDDDVTDFMEYWQMISTLKSNHKLNDFSKTDSIKEPKSAIASNKNKLEFF